MDKSMTRRVISKNMGHNLKFDNSKSKEKLGIEYHSLKSSIIDMFQQMIVEGSFKKS